MFDFDIKISKTYFELNINIKIPHIIKYYESVVIILSN